MGTSLSQCRRPTIVTKLQAEYESNVTRFRRYKAGFTRDASIGRLKRVPDRMRLDDLRLGTLAEVVHSCTMVV
jgi:hypothetical protein